LGYEHVVVFWPTSFLLYDTSIADVRSPWSLAIGVAFGALLLGGYAFQRFVLIPTLTLTLALALTPTLALALTLTLTLTLTTGTSSSASCLFQP